MLLGELTSKLDIITANADMGAVIGGVCFDTRRLKQGDLFVAVRGYRSDGHDFIGSALEKGAACVICESEPAEDVAYVLVKDSRAALADVSAAWFGYPASKIKVIGVTGTNGKTTVTSLVKQVLETLTGKKAGLIGTNGNMIGDTVLHTERTTPESYEVQELLADMAAAGCEYAVMEVTSHALYLERVRGIEFEVGLFTNLSQDHLDFHDSLEEYAKIKARLFSNSRKSAINADDEYASLMAENAEGSVITYSAKDDRADLVAKKIELHEDRVGFCALTIGNLNRVELAIPGMISVYNALSAISAAILLGFDIADVAAAIKSCKGVKGRAEVVHTGGDFTVLIDYAHTPDALASIISTVRGFARGRVITLFGCGGDRDSKKRPLMGQIAAQLSDYVFVTSDNPRTENPAAIIENILAGMKDTATIYEVIENRREAIYKALDTCSTGDVLILAGKGHETYQIIGTEKRDFDERDVVSDYFRYERGQHSGSKL
ncbi:MAG: UDP-N-acetylmuramoyl-L-alanyl-D-glutamate--2,6-diaminopimelate ligase [Oscillospiraceae bacterium]|nr:UDP-N-acetylmuramoyl-L-alanyl-D-glutamate--2,6-diaminopimelate ligase [Oscillospiraceae bacterium]